MKVKFRLFFRISVFVLAFFIASFPKPSQAAGSLTAMSDSLSDNHISKTGVTHTLAFTTATTSTILSMAFQFSTTSGGGTKPAGLNLSSVALGTVSGSFGTGWSIDSGNSSLSTGKVQITRSAGAGTSINSGVAGTISLTTITNSALADCQASSGSLADSCFISITTYSDAAGITDVDLGITTYQVVEDPLMLFQVSSVSAGTTSNGILSSAASTPTLLAFNNLASNQVKYITQKVTITTNAPHGYTVNAYLNQDIKGNYVSSSFSPFGATNATWSTPQTWTTPTGTTANSNSGWIGANTTDTRVTGWSSANQKFGPVGAVSHTILTSTGPDRAGVTIYVTYALGVNSIQTADVYSGLIVYNVQATY